MNRHVRRALSLVEIVVAGFLLLLAIQTIIVPLERSRHSVQQSHSRLDALRVASDLLALSRSQPFERIAAFAGTSAVERGNGLKVYLYRVDVARPSPHFKQLLIEVRWHERGRLRSLRHGTCLQGEQAQ